MRPSFRRTREDYYISIFHSGEDRGYIADIPDLEACSAFGATPVEALEAVLKANEAWLAVAREHGDPVPGRATGRRSVMGSVRQPCAP